MKLKKIFLIALFLSISGKAYSGVTTGQVEAVLRKYCIPKPNETAFEGYSGQTCQSMAQSVYRRTDGSCLCHNSEHLVWDPTIRKCKPKCQPGYHPKFGISKCPGGTGKKNVNDDYPNKEFIK